jgi:hypothetical protein
VAQVYEPTRRTGFLVGTASQICDGLNNDCDDPAWPNLAGTNEADDDGDLTSECAGDCNDQDSEIWGTPGEAMSLSLAHVGGFGGTTTLDWVAPGEGGTAAGMRYDTLRSGDRSEFVVSTDCLESDDGPNTSSSDSDDPASGSVVFYLIRAVNSCPAGDGPLGLTSGQPRTGRSCP